MPTLTWTWSKCRSFAKIAVRMMKNPLHAATAPLAKALEWMLLYWQSPSPTLAYSMKKVI